MTRSFFDLAHFVPDITWKLLVFHLLLFATECQVPEPLFQTLLARVCVREWRRWRRSSSFRSRWRRKRGGGRRSSPRVIWQACSSDLLRFRRRRRYRDICVLCRFLGRFGIVFRVVHRVGRDEGRNEVVRSDSVFSELLYHTLLCERDRRQRGRNI